MSQISFKAQYNERGVQVVSGWDETPLAYHLTIFWTDVDKGEEDVVWTDLSPVKAYPTALDTYRRLLKAMKVEAPEGFWDLVGQQLPSNVAYTWNPETAQFLRTA